MLFSSISLSTNNANQILMLKRQQFITTARKNRYKKQRGYNPNGNCVVVKFLPVPLAVMIATIILKVKPIEAEFAFKEFGTDVKTTLSVFFTASGCPVEPIKMASILSQTFDESGLSINIQELRHALEAFAHKFSPEGSSLIPIFAEQANHAPATSYRYGRDQNCFVGIPADISMANSSACNNWNSFILDSPSLMTNGNKPKILELLRGLELIGLSDIDESLNTEDVPLSSAARGCIATSGGVDECLQPSSSDMSLSESRRMQRLQLSVTSDKSNSIDTSHYRDKSQYNRVDTSVTFTKPDRCPNSGEAEQFLQPSSSDMSADRVPKSGEAERFLQPSSSDMSLLGLHKVQNLLQSSDKSQEEERSMLHAAGEPSHVGTVACHLFNMSPPTQCMKRVRNDQEIQERKLLAQKRLKLLEGLRPMQKQALQFLEASSSSAFILLPTGSGKTHLIWSHKKHRECAVIFVPYRMLGNQQQCVLETNGLTVTWPFQSYPGSIEAMLCRVHFAILPYEAATEAVSFLASLDSIGRLGPIWVDEVHTLASKGRFRQKFDSFWNLGAMLTLQGITHRIIALTATLRHEDVPDIMNRLSLNSVDVFRTSCYRCDARKFYFVLELSECSYRHVGKDLSGIFEWLGQKTMQWNRL
jgi:hypothetical protein